MCKLNFVMLIVLLPVIILASVWTVGANGCDFITIQDAIDDEYNVVESGDTFRVCGGNYGPLVFGAESFTIEPYDESPVYINGTENSRCIEITGVCEDTMIFKNLTIQDGNSNSGGAISSTDNRCLIIDDCIIQNSYSSYNGGGISSNGQLIIHGTIIRDCTARQHGGGIYGSNIVEIANSIVEDCHALYNLETGGGIYINSGALEISNSEVRSCTSEIGGGIGLKNGSTILMDNCIISDCDGSSGGGVYFENFNGDYLDCQIQNSEFINCSSAWGGAILSCDSGMTISNCIFHENSANSCGGAICLSLNDCEGITVNINNCMFYNNSCSYDGGALDITLGHTQEPNFLFIDKITICNNIGNHFDGLDITTEGEGDEAIIKNSIIRDPSSTIGNIDYEYCCLWDGATGYDATCFVADPLFVDENNDDYHLSWDSPCIDAGDPDNDGDFENWVFDEDDQDTDGSRLSIGCFPNEDQDRWEFEDEDIVWMSFPKLLCDGENNGDQVLGSLVFGRFEETTIPDIYMWQESEITGAESFTGLYIYYEYVWDPPNYSFNSTDGLKIKIDDDFDPVSPLISGGLTCKLATSMTVTTGANDLNWVGYFVPYKMNVMDAIDATTLDKLTAIKTHDWSLYKKSGVWYGAQSPGEPTLCYGDMVDLYTDEEDDFYFYWQTFGTSGEEYERKDTQYFSYEEGLDYQSIFVELGEEKPDEIAVYIDGVCRGAEVVDVDSLLEIRAYIMEEPQGQEIEIVTASGRAIPSKVDYQMVNDNGLRQASSIFTDRSKMYQIVSLETGKEVPEPEKVLICYPNPFNPELTIVFFTTECTENTEIKIYNIKGQKVRTLVNTVLSAGEHSVVWQGKDDKGNQVSSGVYFIRMQIGQQVYTGKAVLMK